MCIAAPTCLADAFFSRPLSNADPISDDAAAAAGNDGVADDEGVRFILPSSVCGIPCSSISILGAVLRPPNQNLCKAASRARGSSFSCIKRWTITASLALSASSCGAGGSSCVPLREMTASRMFARNPSAANASSGMCEGWQLSPRVAEATPVVALTRAVARKPRAVPLAVALPHGPCSARDAAKASLARAHACCLCTHVRTKSPMRVSNHPHTALKNDGKER
eukprot:510053-Pleurochrysis_carterae.AAC.1